MQDLHLLHILKNKSLNKSPIQNNLVSMIISIILTIRAIQAIRAIYVQIQIKKGPGFGTKVQMS